MTIWDAAGYLASSLVVTAFCMNDILRLRIVASLSNVAFLAYGLALGLMPVWLLHAMLLPVNLWRLWQYCSQYCSRENAPKGVPHAGAARMGVQHPKGTRSSAKTPARINGAVTRVPRKRDVCALETRCVGSWRSVPVVDQLRESLEV